MAVAYDNDTQSLNLVSVNTTTFAHTCSGSDRALTVDVVMNGTGYTVASITYAGVNLAQVGSISSTGGLVVMERWGLHAPATGSNDVIVTLSGNSLAWDASAMSYTGANQTGGASTFNGFQSQNSDGASTNVSVTVTSAANDLVSVGTGSISEDHTATNGTLRWEDNTGAANTAGATQAGAGSVVCTETWSGVGTAGAHVVVGCNIAIAGGASSTYTLAAVQGSFGV